MDANSSLKTMKRFIIKPMGYEHIEAETIEEAEIKYKKKHNFSDRNIMVSQKALNPHGKYY